MAIEPEKGGKLAHERLQSTLPVRVKTRRQTSRLMGPQGCSAGSIPGRSQRPLIVPLQGVYYDEMASMTLPLVIRF